MGKQIETDVFAFVSPIACAFVVMFSFVRQQYQSSFYLLLYTMYTHHSSKSNILGLLSSRGFIVVFARAS